MMNRQKRAPRAPIHALPEETYLVECFWPGVTRRAVESAASSADVPGSAVCLELILIPEDEIVLGVFRGPSEAAVSDACSRAGLPCDRIVASVGVRPGGG